MQRLQPHTRKPNLAWQVAEGVAQMREGVAARQLLAAIYGWFTEGFETPDLRETKALLTELT